MKGDTIPTYTTLKQYRQTRKEIRPMITDTHVHAAMKQTLDEAEKDLLELAQELQKTLPLTEPDITERKMKLMKLFFQVDSSHKFLHGSLAQVTGMEKVGDPDLLKKYEEEEKPVK